MTSIDAGSAWRIGDVGDPGLQAWLRRKVKPHLFITQERFEADDLVQEMNLHCLIRCHRDDGWPSFQRSPRATTSHLASCSPSVKGLGPTALVFWRQLSPLVPPFVWFVVKMGPSRQGSDH